MNGNTHTRAELAKVITESGKSWWVPELFEADILEKLPSMIDIVSLPPEEEKNYNCFVLALGLQNNERFLGNKAWKFTRNLGNIFDEMIRKGVLVSKQEPEVGDMIVYRTQSEEISHVGLLQQDGKILSKWSWGPLVKHAIFNVPDFYGDTIEWYKLTDPARELVAKKFPQN